MQCRALHVGLSAVLVPPHLLLSRAGEEPAQVSGQQRLEVHKVSPTAGDGTRPRFPALSLSFPLSSGKGGGLYAGGGARSAQLSPARPLQPGPLLTLLLRGCSKNSRAHGGRKGPCCSWPSGGGTASDASPPPYTPPRSPFLPFCGGGHAGRGAVPPGRHRPAAARLLPTFIAW